MGETTSPRFTIDTCMDILDWFNDDTHDYYKSALWETMEISTDKVLDLNGHQFLIRYDSNRSNALAVGWDGGLYVNNHAGAIGELVTTDINTAVSVATADYTTIGNITLTAGVWVVKYNVIFANNATGRRAIVLSTSSDSAGSSAEQRVGMASQMAVSGMGTVMCNDRIISTAGTYRLNVYQNSGSALNVTGYIRAVRIA